ncbi:MAG: hypothetical protein ACLQVD_19455 [Capsulimonadaceae bacterium]
MRYRPKNKTYTAPPLVEPPVDSVRMERIVPQGPPDLRWIVGIIVALTVAWLAVQPLLHRPPYHYTVTTVASEGVSGQDPPRINALGQIAFTAMVTTNSGTRVTACFFDGKTVHVLPMPGGATSTSALAINDAGVVVGSADNGSGHKTTVLWQGNLCQVLKGEAGDVYGINDAGQIVTSDENGHAALWDKGSWKHVDLFPSGQNRAVSIDDNGVITGVASPAGNSLSQHVYRFVNGRAVDRGILSDSENMHPMAGNKAGDLAGTCGGDDHPCCYRKGSLVDLSTHGNLRMMLPAEGLNDRGDVVGGTQSRYARFLGNDPAVLWHDDVPYTLDDIANKRWGASIVGAGDINNRGQIAAIEILTSNGTPSIVRLDPQR